jgi:hypothetical protein
MTVTKQTKRSKDTSTNQTNKVLDFIPEKIKDKVSDCAKEVKGMVFGIGWSQEQRKCLFNLAHKENVYPGYGEFLHIDCLYHSKETVQEDIKNILKKDFRGDKIILKTEEIQSENEDNLISLNKNKRKYKTLFFDNLTNFDTDLLQSLIKLNKYKERGKIDIKNQPKKYLKQFEVDKHSWFESKKKVGEGLYNATYKWIFKPLIIIYSHVELHDWFKKEFEEIPLSPEPKAEVGQQGRKGKEVSFDDVKLKISADNLGHALDEAFVSVNNGKKEKLDLVSRFIEGLHSLAEAVKENKLDGWVFNKDLDKTCSDSPDKLKYEIIKAFGKITGIGKRAKGIISIKHGAAKKLNIPKKNISFKRIS